jgi:hypothetical protein
MNPPEEVEPDPRERCVCSGRRIEKVMADMRDQALIHERPIMCL